MSGTTALARIIAFAVAVSATCAQAERPETYLFQRMDAKFPKLVKRGAVSPNGEVSPFVHKGRLMRMELEDPSRYMNAQDPRICAIIRDVETGKIVSRTGEGCYFLSAFAEGDKVYVTGVKRAEKSLVSDTILLFETDDLVTWKSRMLLQNPGFRFFNTTMTKGPHGYVLALESDDKRYAKRSFTMFFATSKDLKEWTFMDYRYAYPQDRYCGGPFICYCNGWYYLSLVTEMPCERYCTYLHRSKDLMTWEVGRHNPFLMWSEEDRTIAPDARDFTPAFAAKIPTGFICNASDVEMCEFKGRTYIPYLTGDQHGWYYMCEAWYDGPMSELLENFFK